MRYIVIFCVILFSLLLYTFYPGWMTPDSLVQYTDARVGVYYDWHPIVMAWWWRQLTFIADGPVIFLMQNILLYCVGTFFFVEANRRFFGSVAGVIAAFLSCTPGVLAILGVIWKDIFFGVLVYFGWSLLIYICALKKKPSRLAQWVIFLAGTMALAVKPNGLPSVLFLFLYYFILHSQSSKPLALSLLKSIGLLAASIGLALSLSSLVDVKKTYPFQYTQVYDLLGISVRSSKVFLPEFITDLFSTDVQQLSKYYFAGGNNLLFFGTHGPLRTTEVSKISELNKRWIDAIQEYPLEYIAHRWDNFIALLRIGSFQAAYITNPGIVDNNFGFSFQSNIFSNLIVASISHAQWLYLPWVYLSMLGIAYSIISFRTWNLVLSTTLFLSAITFILPHIFIAPASDYRYLFYSYLCSVQLATFAINIVVSKYLKSHHFD